MTATVAELYEKWRRHLNHSTAEHLPYLRNLAARCAVAVELGVKDGATASALLMGADEVWSYDIEPSDAAKEMAAGCSRWHYVIADSRSVQIPECDLLWIDSLHNYAQLKTELWRHHCCVRRWIVMHDVVAFGSWGQEQHDQPPERHDDGAQRSTYGARPLGLMPAVLEFLAANREWMVERFSPASRGLLTLARRSEQRTRRMTDASAPTKQTDCYADPERPPC
jgi:hypothetical protein